MTEPKPVELTEDRVPFAGIETSIDELVEMYGGDVTAQRERARDFILPLRRGGAGAGIECTVSWAPTDERDAVVTLLCNRNVDAPRGQRIFLLIAGVLGAVLFMLWPFYPHERAWGSLAWLGGIIALAVYLMTLRKSSGGIAFDFLRRLAERQRSELSAGASED